jgi:phage terminase large subunit-like protein
MRFNRPVKGRIIANDFTNAVGGVIIPFLDEWLDQSIVAKKTRNAIGIYVKWALKNGSSFDILSCEQEVKNYEGWKGDIAWFDEPPPRDRYISTARGMVDSGGRIWLTLTPLKTPWIYDEIFKKHDGTKVFVVTMDMTDNLKRIDSSGRKLGALTQENIDEFESKLNSDEKLARMHGAFMHLIGRVYPSFDPRIHVIEPFKIKPNWPRYMCIDPHPRKPTAVLWLCVDEHDNHYVYDELSFAGDAVQMSHMINSNEAELIAHQRFIDPAMDKDNNLFGGMNFRKELAKYGIYCQRANNDFDLGYNRVLEALRPQYSALLKTEVPRLKIFNTCVKTIYEFEHYMWADRKHNPDENPLLERVNKRDDDFMDCLRYIYNSGPRYYDVSGNDDEEEVVYTGTYVKYPTKQTISVKESAYHTLVERQDE